MQAESSSPEEQWSESLAPCLPFSRPPGHIFPLVYCCYPACQTRRVICNYCGLQCIPRAPWVCLMF